MGDSGRLLFPFYYYLVGEKKKSFLSNLFSSQTYRHINSETRNSIAYIFGELLRAEASADPDSIYFKGNISIPDYVQFIIEYFGHFHSFHFFLFRIRTKLISLDNRTVSHFY